MKHNLNLIVLVLAAISFTSCGIIDAALQIKNETKYENTSVLLEDGTILEGSAIIPNGSTKTLNFKNSEGKKQKINASEIDCIYIWHKNHEDKKHLLLYKEYLYYSSKKKGDIYRNGWMSPMAIGEHLIIMIFGADYQLAANGDILVIGQTLPYFGFKEGISHGSYVAAKGNSKANARKSLVEFLSDDPELCKDIEEKSVDPFDFETICDSYNPKRIQE